MKIEVGKFYKTRGGDIVAVFEELKDGLFGHPFVAVVYKLNRYPKEITYTPDGKALMGVESPEDIVSEWNPEHNENQNENPKTELKWTQTVS